MEFIAGSSTPVRLVSTERSEGRLFRLALKSANLKPAQLAMLMRHAVYRWWSRSPQSLFVQVRISSLVQFHQHCSQLCAKPSCEIAASRCLSPPRPSFLALLLASKLASRLSGPDPPAASVCGWSAVCRMERTHHYVTTARRFLSRSDTALGIEAAGV